MQLASSVGAVMDDAGQFARIAGKHAPLMDEFRNPSSTHLGAATVELMPTRRTDRIARVLDDPEMPAYMSKKHPDMRWQKAPGARLFGDGGLPRMQDVTQGFLGNCWFVAHMGAMAHADPVAVRSMFEETKHHYIVHFADESVAVSKRLPMLHGRTAFAGQSFQAAQSRTGVWAAVLEKAAAAREAHGYESLKGGQARWGFRLSLGATPTRIAHPQATPFDDAVRGAELRIPTAIGTMPGATSSEPVLRMTLGQRQLLDDAKVYGNHYYVVTGTGQAKDGSKTIRLWEPHTFDNGSDGHREFTRDHFNTVVTDTDTTERYGDYMRSAEQLRADLHVQQRLVTEPWFANMDPVSGFLS